MPPTSTTRSRPTPTSKPPPGFRAEFLRTLERLEDIRWWMAPSHGTVHIRIPCPECGWAEKRADRTKLARLDEDGATFGAVCLDHGDYETHVDPEDDQPYLDLATLYRNLVKERAFGRDTGVLHVMMKGGDWAFGCQLVDGALGALGTPAAQMPVRISCANTARASYPPTSSPGCLTSAPGPANSTTTSTHWFGSSAS